MTASLICIRSLLRASSRNVRRTDWPQLVLTPWTTGLIRSLRSVIWLNHTSITLISHRSINWNILNVAVISCCSENLTDFGCCLPIKGTSHFDLGYPMLENLPSWSFANIPFSGNLFVLCGYPVIGNLTNLSTLSTVGCGARPSSLCVCPYQ